MKDIVLMISEILWQPLIETLVNMGFLLWGISLMQNDNWVGAAMIALVFIVLFIQSSICHGYMLKEKRPDLFEDEN